MLAERGRGPADRRRRGGKTRRQAGCSLMQLTTDKTRKRAQAFYESRGYTASHEGFKRLLG